MLFEWLIYNGELSLADLDIFFKSLKTWICRRNLTSFSVKFPVSFKLPSGATDFYLHSLDFITIISTSLMSKFYNFFLLFLTPCNNDVYHLVILQINLIRFFLTMAWKSHCARTERWTYCAQPKVKENDAIWNIYITKQVSGSFQKRLSFYSEFYII